MKHLVNGLVAILMWLAAFAIGFGSWLGWAMLVVAVFQSIGTLTQASKASE